MKLVKFLMKLKNEQVTIHLKNGTEVTGVIQSVDIKMNIHLKSVKIIQKQKNAQQEELLDSYSI